MKSQKNILVCPLDWGLGHATRCVPIINELKRLGYNVIIGADKNPLAFLKQEFPDLKTVIIPGYTVSYDEQGSSFKLFCESVRFYNFIKKEHQFLETIIEENNINIIVSDNRYGLWSKKIKSILITHQLYVKVPIGEKIAHNKIEKLIANFDECWIPDVEGKPNLSGDLSHLKPVKHSHCFIGPLSRFSRQIKDFDNEEIDVFAILSGPEPQRTIFEKLVLEQIENNNLKSVVVRGLPSSNEELKNKSENLKIFNHLSTREFLEYFQKSKVVVSRAGYSSIMDLATLGKKAILVPTPGQTEQEYLAEYHCQKGRFYTQKQSEFDLEKGIIEIQKCSFSVPILKPLRLENLL